MKELLGRLEGLDPEVSEGLKVISYFDVLTDAHVGVETLLRGAATLTGATVGYRTPQRVLRVLGNGRATGEGAVTHHALSHRVGAETTVWIERGAPHANDAIVLERLAMAVAAVHVVEPAPVRRAIELLLEQPLDAGADDARQLATAMARVRLEPHAAVRAVAIPLELPVPAGWAQATLATPWGIARGAIVAAHDERRSPVAGVGVPVTAIDLRRSWRTAVIALRLTEPNRPVVQADELGSLLDLAEWADAQPDEAADVVRIRELVAESWPLQTLQAVADGASLRSIASGAGLHHSSVHARLPLLARRLGFDPRTPLGRTRLSAALILYRLARPRFDETPT